MTADDDMTRENSNDGLLSQLGALRNRLAAADPGFNAAARVERDAEALCDEVRSDLKAYRHTLGVSQKELAERVELGQSAISKIESGRGDLSVKTVFRVAKALGLRPVLAFAPATHAAEDHPSRRKPPPRPPLWRAPCRKTSFAKFPISSRKPSRVSPRRIKSCVVVRLDRRRWRHPHRGSGRQGPNLSLRSGAGGAQGGEKSLARPEEGLEPRLGAPAQRL